MTYQAAIASALESAATDRRQQAKDAKGADRKTYRAAAERLDELAASFKAGDFDAVVMAEYAALAQDTETKGATSQAAHSVMMRIGIDAEGFETPDDVLDAIIREARHLA